MFPRAALTFLVVGALSVNALTGPVARSPAPGPGREFPRSFSTVSYHDLTLVPSTVHVREARFALFTNIRKFFTGKREVLDELFLRESDG